jgi:hypothetical protein
MYSKNVFKISAIAIASIFFITCKQSAPPTPITQNGQPASPGAKGDLSFSGYNWVYKNAISLVGPGPNRFSGTSDFAWVDSAGQLHMKIAKKNGLWTCSEIVSTRVFGYGKYIFTCNSDITNFNEKAVFGAFTWDNYSFQTQGNSEIDVEFSRWNKPSDSNLVTYSAQPVWFSTPGPYAERTYKANVATTYLTKPVTYMMQWTADSVHWESYEGLNYPGTNQLNNWTFTKNNMPRRKIEGSFSSNEIVIPAPSDSTNFRFNFWLLNGQSPTNNQPHEIVISNFKYIGQ